MFFFGSRRIWSFQSAVSYLLLSIPDARFSDFC